MTAILLICSGVSSKTTGKALDQSPSLNRSRTCDMQFDELLKTASFTASV